MQDELRRRDARHAPGIGAKLVSLASGALVVLLVGYLSYHALTAPAESEPAASILSSAPDPSGGAWHVVTVSDHGERGLLRVEVEVACGEDIRELRFEHVPAEGTPEAYVHCADGGASPEARVVSYQRT